MNGKRKYLIRFHRGNLTLEEIVEAVDIAHAYLQADEILANLGMDGLKIKAITFWSED